MADENVQVEVVEEVQQVAEQMTLRVAVQAVLKQAIAHDGLVRGLHECAKALDRGKAIFCLLAADCDEDAYTRLVVALCAARKISLIRVPEGKLLGQWAGLCKIDKEGQPRKVVRCSCAVVTNVGSEVTEAISYLNEQLKQADIELE